MSRRGFTFVEGVVVIVVGLAAEGQGPVVIEEEIASALEADMRSRSRSCGAAASASR